MKSSKLYLLFILIVLGLTTQAQEVNLIYNGNFETWDSTLYPLNDGGNTELCKESTGLLRNERSTAYRIKYVDCVKWLPYYGPESAYYKYGFTWECCNPEGYKNCYNQQYLGDFGNDTNFQRNGTTFITMNFHYDTIAKKYTRGKQFLYMPLTKALVKGKTYQLDFDLKTGRFFNQSFFNIDTVTFYGCKGFGFGFTEQKPTFIQNNNTYETDLKPEISIDYYNEKNWKNNSRYFTADSNYKYIVFGYFKDALNTHVTSNTPYCQNQYKDEIYCINQIDNLFLKEAPNLLPADTAICEGKDITITANRNKKIDWYINSALQATQTNTYTLKPNANTILTVTDSISTDTMNIEVAPYPIFNITQTDTLCNNITGFVANPNTYTYTWLPENINGNKAVFEGNAIRQIIASNKQGCKDTLDFTPILGNATCGTYYIPNSFTPNGDQLNDEFGVVGVGVEEVMIQIYNTWGELIFQTKQNQTTWNGQYDNKICPAGVYIYKIEVSYKYNNKIKKAYENGTLHLIR